MYQELQVQVIELLLENNELNRAKIVQIMSQYAALEPNNDHATFA